MPFFRILAIETSTERCSVALATGSQIRSVSKIAGQKHSGLLLPMIDTMMREAGLGIGELDAIAFGAGPGSFTGLRIACGVAQGLAFAVGCKVVPVCTLEALAEASGGVNVVVCTDARMGQVYLGAFEREESGWQTRLAPMLCDPHAVPMLPGTAWLGCGSGFGRYPDIGAGPYAGVVTEFRSDIEADAREVAILAVQKLAAGGGVDATAAAPIYVRNKVALTMVEQKQEEQR